MASETHREQVERVELMAANVRWRELSDNDCAALRTVLLDRAELLEALTALLASVEYARIGALIIDNARAALTKATEGAE